MQIEQSRWSQATCWEREFPGRSGLEARFVLLFGSLAYLKQTRWQDELRGADPKAHWLRCSRAGEIYGTEVE